jgi:hypothetical protein
VSTLILRLRREACRTAKKFDAQAALAACGSAFKSSAGRVRGLTSGKNLPYKLATHGLHRDGSCVSSGGVDQGRVEMCLAIYEALGVFHIIQAACLPALDLYAIVVKICSFCGVTTVWLHILRL